MPRLSVSSVGRALGLRALTVVVAALVLPAALSAQTKGTVVDNASKEARLPAPQLTVTDMGDGCVGLRWTPVPRAKYYVLGRALGTNGLQRLNATSDASRTEYRDRVADAGTPVVYRVTAIDSAEIAGLPGTSTRFIASGGKAADCPIEGRGPPDVRAVLRGKYVVVTWRRPERMGPLDGFEVRHYLDGRELPSSRVGAFKLPEVGVPADPGEHRFEVRVVDRSGRMSDPTASNPIVVGKDAVDAGAFSPVGPSAPAAGTIRPSEVALVVAAPLLLRMGATASVPAAAGARWSTLDPGIVSVDAAGTISAVAAGQARVVALSPQPDGTLRITVVHVVVTP